MDFTAETTNGHTSPASLLNPMSPPPRSNNPTLSQMIAGEPIVNRRTTRTPAQDNQGLTMQRVSDLLMGRGPEDKFDDPKSSDIKLKLSSKDGVSVSVNVHSRIVVARSSFLADEISSASENQRGTFSEPLMVEITDCDDVEVYMETLRLMYCEDLKRRLIGEDVLRVLEILKVSKAIGFQAGLLSCMEYLEAAPWTEDEEHKVVSVLSELHLDNVESHEVLNRLSTEVITGSEEVLLNLFRVVFEGKDEKARREMKGFVSKMLHQNSFQNDPKKESLYLLCNECLQLLSHHFHRAVSSDLNDVGQISRQADNLLWMLDILIDKQLAEDFLEVWSSQSELSEIHSKVPAVHRYEVSRITARLFVGIGKGQILGSKDVRVLLLKTWLVPFYDDFGWMGRWKGLDRHVIEDGLSNTILTLPLARQQDILLDWFDRFLKSGDDCPNIQRGFEIWWRRVRTPNGFASYKLHTKG